MLSIGALGALSLGCAEPEASERFGFERAPIIGGEASPAGPEDGVLLLRTELDGEELLCSASLLAPRLALTARHCVAHVERGPFNCSVRGELFDNPSGAGRLGLDLPAESLEFYGGAVPRTSPLARGARIFSTLTESACVNDLAFVVLDRDVALPALPLRLEGEAEKGEAVTLVGYGLTDVEQPVIDVRRQPRMHRTGLVIAGVGPDTLEGVTTVQPRALLLEGESGCVGDSGGPLLAAETHAVLGVYSLLNGESCAGTRVRHLLVHVPAFEALRLQAFRAAEADPIPEARPSPTAAAGAGGESGASSATDPEPSSSEAGARAHGGAPPEEPPAEEPPRNTGRNDSGCALHASPRPVPSGRAEAALLVGLLAVSRRRFRRGALAADLNRLRIRAFPKPRSPARTARSARQRAHTCRAGAAVRAVRCRDVEQCALGSATARCPGPCVRDGPI